MRQQKPQKCVSSLSLHLSGIWTKYLDFHDSCHFSGGGGDGKFPFWPPASVPVETGIGKPDFNLLLTLFILLLLQLAFFCRDVSSWRTKNDPATELWVTCLLQEITILFFPSVDKISKLDVILNSDNERREKTFSPYLIWHLFNIDGYVESTCTWTSSICFKK